MTESALKNEITRSQDPQEKKTFLKKQHIAVEKLPLDSFELFMSVS